MARLIPNEDRYTRLELVARLLAKSSVALKIPMTVQFDSTDGASFQPNLLVKTPTCDFEVDTCVTTVSTILDRNAEVDAYLLLYGEDGEYEGRSAREIADVIYKIVTEAALDKASESIWAEEVASSKEQP